jgi:hypothetical protein
MDIILPILLLLPFIFFILFLLSLRFNIFEGLQENNTLPPANLLTYDVSNITQVYHPTYIDTNIDASGGFALPVFYKPNSYKYSSKSYVPNYVDTIYMSSLTGLSNVAQYHDNNTSHNQYLLSN